MSTTSPVPSYLLQSSKATPTPLNLSDNISSLESGDSYKTSLNKRLILDNGSYNLRFGTAASPPAPRITRNLQATNKRSGESFYCEDAEQILAESSFKYSKPHVRGVLTNFDTQMHIWNHLIKDTLKDRSGKGYSISLNTPLIAPQRSQQK